MKRPRDEDSLDQRPSKKGKHDEAPKDLLEDIQGDVDFSSFNNPNGSSNNNSSSSFSTWSPQIGSKLPSSTTTRLEVKLDAKQWTEVLLTSLEKKNEKEFEQRLKDCEKSLKKEKNNKVYAKFQKIIGREKERPILEGTILYTILQMTNFEILNRIIETEVSVAHRQKNKIEFSKNDAIRELLENILITPFPLKNIVKFLDYIKKNHKSDSEDGYKSLFDNYLKEKVIKLRLRRKLIKDSIESNIPTLDKMKWLVANGAFKIIGVVKAIINKSSHLPRIEKFFSDAVYEGGAFFSFLCEQDSDQEEIFELALRKANKYCLRFFLESGIKPMKWTPTLASSLGLIGSGKEPAEELLKEFPIIQNTPEAISKLFIDVLLEMAGSYHKHCIYPKKWRSLYAHLLSKGGSFTDMKPEDQCKVISGCQYFLSDIDPFELGSLETRMKEVSQLITATFGRMKLNSQGITIEKQSQYFSSIVSTFKSIAKLAYTPEQSYKHSTDLFKHIAFFLKKIDLNNPANYFWIELLMSADSNLSLLPRVPLNVHILEILSLTKPLKLDFGLAIKAIVNSDRISLDNVRTQLEGILQNKSICDRIINKNVLGECLHLIIKKYHTLEWNQYSCLNLIKILGILEQLGANYNHLTPERANLFLTHLINLKFHKNRPDKEAFLIFDFLHKKGVNHIEKDFIVQNPNFTFRFDDFGYIAYRTRCFDDRKKIYKSLQDIFLETPDYLQAITNGIGAANYQLTLYRQRLMQPVPQQQAPRGNANLAQGNRQLAPLPKLHEDDQSTHTLAIHQQTADIARKLRAEYFGQEASPSTYKEKLLQYFYAICHHFEKLVLTESRAILNNKYPQNEFKNPEFREEVINNHFKTIDVNIKKGYYYSDPCPLLLELWNNINFTALRWLKLPMSNPAYCLYQEPISKITIYECLIFVWVAIHDKNLGTNTEDAMLRQLAQAIAKIQREYNNDAKPQVDKKEEKSGKDEKDSGKKEINADKDRVSCPAGAFNMLISVLEGQHKLVPPLVQISSGHIWNFITAFYEEEFRNLTPDKKTMYFGYLFNTTDLDSCKLPQNFVSEFKAKFYSNQKMNMDNKWIKKEDIDSYFSSDDDDIGFPLISFPDIYNFLKNYKGQTNNSSSSSSSHNSSQSSTSMKDDGVVLGTTPSTAQNRNTLFNAQPQDATTATPMNLEPDEPSSNETTKPGK